MQRKKPVARATPLWLLMGLFTGAGCEGAGSPPAQEPRPASRSSSLEAYGPDLVVTELHAPPSIRPGQYFKATVTVCNQGTLASETYGSWSSLELYLSTDQSLSFPGAGMPPPTDQVMLYGTGLPPLDPGQCLTQTLELSAALPPDAQGNGAYYLGAIADAFESLTELREDNNVLVSEPVGVGYGPDLVVTQVKAPASVRQGQSFTATVEVCNQGTESSGSYSQAQLELYLSVDDSLTVQQPGGPMPTDQRRVGSLGLPSLNPGQCVLRTVSANAELPPDAQGDGAYHVGAIVDPYQSEQELREDNNVHVAGLVGVGQRADLVVTQVTGPASVGSGDAFTATVTVCNQGTESSGSFGQSQVDLYLSLDDSLTAPQPGMPLPTDQRLIGSLSVQSLNAGQCITRTLPASAMLPPDAQGDGGYFLGAIVDPNQSEQELREDNNVHVAGRLGVGSRADLVVTELKGPASAAPGDTFTATVTVCNQGTESANGYSQPVVELYVSSDTALTLPSSSGPGMPMPDDQQLLGSVSLPWLDAGQCVTRSVQAHADQPPAAQGDGAFYLAAIVDPYQSEQELREDNNVHVAGLMGVGYGPDLVVKRVSGPVSVRSGDSFLATVEVCNQGTESTGGWYGQTLQVELYLSLDATLTHAQASGPAPMPTDQRTIGVADLPSLSAGQCVTRTQNVYASVPPDAMGGEGALYLGAIVDVFREEEELREDNNVFIGGLMGVGHRSDLVVTDVKAPANVRPGDTFTATVTVCNQGTEATGGFGQPQLELYVSMDTALTFSTPSAPGPQQATDQRLLASVGVPHLFPTQCVPLTMNAYAGFPPDAMGEAGAFYLGAIVDVSQTEQELREDNNVYLAGLMGVGTHADLVVTELKGPPSVRPGDTFTATVTVCNQGTDPSGGGWSGQAQLELYLSTTTALKFHPTSGPGTNPLDQRMVASTSVRTLYPGECESQTLNANASLPHGTQPDGALYLGAIVDAFQVEQELREDNNVHIAGLMGVGHRADLVVTELKGPPSVRPGDFFTATVKVCNQGTEATSGWYGQAQLELYLSRDTVLTPPSTSGPGTMPTDQRTVATVPVQELGAGRCTSLTVNASAQRPQDAMADEPLYLGAFVDAFQAQQELREDNNLHVGGLMGVGHRSDLVVTEVSGPASVRHGDSFNATVKVCNQGTETTSGWYSQPRVELYLSRDTTVTPPPMGPSYPDNDQRLIGSVELPPMAAGQCVTRTVSANASPPYPQAPGGLETAFYLGAIVDPNQSEQELREDNNVTVGTLIGVGNLADLVVTQVQGPPSVRHGDAFTATVTVCNQGTYSSGGWYGQSRLALYLSADDTLAVPSTGGPNPYPTTDEQEVASDYLPSLQPGQCVTRVLTANAQPPPGPYSDRAWYLGATIDTQATEQELREDNNSLVGGLVGVGFRADLVVTEVSGPASVRPGDSFNATVQVCNQGTYGSGGWYGQTRLELYQSRTPELAFPEPGPGSQNPDVQWLVGGIDVMPLMEGQCVTLTVPASAHGGYGSSAPRAWYLGAIVDAHQGEQELREDNNVTVGGLMGVGNDADLVVTAVSGPPAVQRGGAFTADVTVCNQGTEPSNHPYVNGHLELYLSLDTSVTVPVPGGPGPMYPPNDQVLVGSLDVGTLAPAQCVTVAVPAAANLLSDPAWDDGAFYLAAAIDTASTISELREDNNVTVGGLMGVGSRPDLVVTSVTAPSSVQHGAVFTASVEVCNQGTTPVDGTYGGPMVELYISLDTTLTAGGPGPMSMDQYPVGSTQLGALAAGQCTTLSLSGNAHAPPAGQGAGAYFLGAIIDPHHGHAELREDNNSRADHAFELTW
ncbi:CARDB domain-containing protein [Pyxidicoccus xibeiensis]|uniref:CARDB domain-containing protein n=1 Tax=Pyxidicoccus xibeiensis TaxID=2906759 RepID=UPI0020A72D67|nr:CARDB domain-containing protein [Pyxidicoccus xibeiensis]MCP3138825.1 hypothetical protein [Pyxidicoccus xibeiensis]